MHQYNLSIDPITRIEGHLGIEVLADEGIVKEAKASGTLFRGFEIILKGRDPRDANRLTQRVCGVCPTSHATASSLCLESAFGIKNKIPENGKIIRNLILGCNFLQSHILHFYHLAALDYFDPTKVVKDVTFFTHRYEGDYRLSDKANQEIVNHYIKALDIRRKTHELLAIFGGKMPHNIGVIPGGITEKPTEDKITNFFWRLNEIREFIDSCYIPDVIILALAYPDYFEIGKGCQNFLTYGGFELGEDKFFKPGRVSGNLKLNFFDEKFITEDVKHSWYDNSPSRMKPAEGETKPKPDKKSGYSFIKSPRYQGKVYETGPLARIVINYLQGNPKIKKLTDSLLDKLKIKLEDLFSVLGRHTARALECKIIAESMADWLLKLKPQQPTVIEYQIPNTAEGSGLTEAPRGSLGHWIAIKDKKIERYQIVTPTAWNGSPKDDENQPGPIEQALIGVKIKDKENPFEIVRTVRSFDPCLACAVHLITPKGRRIGSFEVV